MHKYPDPAQEQAAYSHGIFSPYISFSLPLASSLISLIIFLGCGGFLQIKLEAQNVARELILFFTNHFTHVLLS